jgi:hypothetical protein
MQAVYAVQTNEGDMEMEFKRGISISKAIKKSAGARFHLEGMPRQISFEEFKEIQLMDDGNIENEYQNENLNVVAKGVMKEMSEWDYKKE